jgi:type IV pilus assembly protein PilV
MQSSIPKGFSFIEVLITLLVFSLGLLGIAGLEIIALRNTQKSYMRSIATVQIASMLERLHANHSSNTRSAECLKWNQENQQLLPQASGNCSCQNSICYVTIKWKDGHLSMYISV